MSDKPAEKSTSSIKANEQALSVDPEVAKFTVAGGKSEHMLVNLTARHLAIKVRCSNNNLYRVHPVYQVVETGQCKSMVVTRHFEWTNSHPKPPFDSTWRGAYSDILKFPQILLRRSFRKNVTQRLSNIEDPSKHYLVKQNIEDIVPQLPIYQKMLRAELNRMVAPNENLSTLKRDMATRR